MVWMYLFIAIQIIHKVINYILSNFHVYSIWLFFFFFYWTIDVSIL